MSSRVLLTRLGQQRPMPSPDALASGPNSPPRNLGIAFFATQSLCFAVETAAFHQLGTSGAGWNAMQLAALRNLGGLVMVVGVAAVQRQLPWRSRAWKLQLLRGSVSAVAMWIIIFVYGRLPLSNAAAIFYTQAIFLVLYGLALEEAVTRRGWAAVALGLAGMLLIVKPAFAGDAWVYPVAVVGTALNALLLPLTRQIERQDTTLTVLFYVSLIGLATSITGTALQPLPQVPSLFSVVSLALASLREDRWGNCVAS
jgi:drug/metabolite transporter (DMT)-like permease